MKYWKILGKFLLILTVFFLLISQYYFLKNIFYEKEKKISSKVSSKIKIWYLERKKAHFILYPYFFNNRQQILHDQFIEKTIPSKKQTYYVLHIINFCHPGLKFLDHRDFISILLEKSQKKNVCVWEKNQKANLFYNIFGQVEKIPPGYSKRYLVAFPRPLKYSQIRGVKLFWEGKYYTFASVIRNRSEFDEYLWYPTPSFYKPQKKSIK